MTEPVKPTPPGDDEIAALIAQAERGKGSKHKPDPDQPGPRLPEALYFYLFILAEIALMLGVWGFMQRGTDAVLAGPGLDAPVAQQVRFHLWSIGSGLVEAASTQPWIPAGLALLAGVVFVPRTPRARKRTASLVSGIMVALLIVLIALQFSADLEHLADTAFESAAPAGYDAA